MTTPVRVGFVGLGNMGFPMASHLVRAGHELVVADARREAVDRFVAEHTTARPADSLEMLGRSVGTVITMLPSSKIVRAVILGEEGGDCVAAGLETGDLVIDMSTSDPVDTRSLGAALAERGVGTVDSPVAGGVVFARDATLSMMVGGDPELVARCQPLLEVMGRDIFRCGALGAGHAMKALNNYVNASALVTAFEALCIGRRFGLDTQTMLASMTAAATGRNNPIEKKVLPYIDDPDYATGMALTLLAKDVRITRDMAAAIDAYAPVADRVSALWTEAAERFGEGGDQIDVVKLWLEGSGVDLRD